jgi:hypothetical protein
MVMQRTAHDIVRRIVRVGAACGVLVSLPIFSTSAFALEVSDVISKAQSTTKLAHDLISYAYGVAPALVLGLGLLVILPVLAVLAPVVTTLRQPDDATRRYKAGADDDIADDITGDGADIPAHAFLEVVDGPETKFAILRDMLRIGREDDNDIRIPSPAVHRYHAAIHREHMEDWHITDLSGADGNGIRVNGQKCSDAALHDGDVIELGPGRLRFRAGLC